MLRADANIAMGTGHVMRCLALAQAWQDGGGHAAFAMADGTPSVARRLRDEKVHLENILAAAGTAEDAECTRMLGDRLGARWIVVDGYHFDSAYQRAIKEAGFKLLVLDDSGSAPPYSADLVLNQNAHAASSLYNHREPHTRLLLGPRYALLRREFRRWREWNRDFPEVGRKILVSMGGSDPDNVTAKVIQAIQALPSLNLETVVLVGGSNPHLQCIHDLLSPDGHSIRLMIDAANVGEWMAWADVMVSGAGTTFWEMCLLGLPGMLVVLAENQQAIASCAESMEIAWNLGSGAELKVGELSSKLAHLACSVGERKAQSERGRKLVDGRGAERVVSSMRDVQLRRTIDADCEVFWEWALDPKARAVSFSNGEISWEHHTQWFRSRMQDRDAILYTAIDDAGLPLGSVRFHIQQNRAVLSIILGARFRGRGLGFRILTESLDKVFRDSAVEFVDAYVKPTNEASLKLFASAGFSRMASRLIEGQEGVHFVLQRKASR